MDRPSLVGKSVREDLKGIEAVMELESMVTYSGSEKVLRVAGERADGMINVIIKSATPIQLSAQRNERGDSGYLPIKKG